MRDAQKRIAYLIKECYAYVYYRMIDEHKYEYETFIECNRGTFAPRSYEKSVIYWK